LLIGFGLHVLSTLSRDSLTLVLVAMMLPEIILMPRGGLLDWISFLVRNGISLLILYLGWKFYTLLTSIPASNGLNSSAGVAS